MNSMVVRLLSGKSYFQATRPGRPGENGQWVMMVLVCSKRVVIIYAGQIPCLWEIYRFYFRVRTIPIRSYFSKLDSKTTLGILWEDRNPFLPSNLNHSLLDFRCCSIVQVSSLRVPCDILPSRMWSEQSHEIFLETILIPELKFHMVC